MSWVQTYTKKRIYPLSPVPKDIDIVDIAHSLSMMVRYNGHCEEFYSVAQHSVLVSHVAKEEYALHGLLHDASEVYLSDFPGPIKPSFPDYLEAEERVMMVVFDKFGLKYPIPANVELADRFISAVEVRDIINDDYKEWNLPNPGSAPKIKPVGHKEAEKMFLDRYMEIRDASNTGG
jgi:5'-deoxynucleotidase YfbR-like HD superfamily hydrolase